MSFNESFGEQTSQIVEVIGFGRRFAAYLIDGFVLWIIQIGIMIFAGIVVSVVSTANEDVAVSLSLLLNCLSLLISVGYFIVFWATTGQTPGKMALGIKVISTDGTPVSWGKAILRYIGYIISSLALSIGFIWIAFDAKRQGWHDKIANTYVVRKETNFSPNDVITFEPSDKGSSSAVVIIIGVILMFFVMPVVVIAILLLLGPVVGDVFSNIVEELGTPTP